MANRTPLPTNPTPADLAKGQGELHECLHEAREEIGLARAEIAGIGNTLAETKQALELQTNLADARHEAQLAYQALMLAAFRITPPPADPSPGAPPPPPPKAKVGLDTTIKENLGWITLAVGLITAIDKCWPLLSKIPNALGGN